LCNEVTALNPTSRSVLWPTDQKTNENITSVVELN
jgi:hypothetical protein